MTDRTLIAHHWQQFVSLNSPEFFITLTYRYPYCDRTAEQGLRFFYSRLVRSLPRRTQPGVSGVVVAERTMKNIRFEGSLHFHLLIWGLTSQLPDADVLVPLAARKAADAIRSPDGSRMSSAERVDVQRVKPLDADVVSSYQCKDILRIDRPCGMQILPLAGEQVLGSWLIPGEQQA